MPVIRVFEPALCCNTGVCGPDLDQELVDFTAAVNALKAQGVDVHRANLASEPAQFAEHPVVVKFLQAAGSEGLPLTLVDDVTVLAGRHPRRGFAGRGTPAAAIVAVAVFQVIGDVGMAGAEGLRDLSVILGPLVGVLDHQLDRRAGGAALEGARQDADLVGFAALRGGQVVGEHTLLFAAGAEHIALSHRSFDRRAYATGAVRAALWLHGRAPGLYDMKHVLGMA